MAESRRRQRRGLTERAGQREGAGAGGRRVAANGKRRGKRRGAHHRRNRRRWSRTQGAQVTTRHVRTHAHRRGRCMSSLTSRRERSTCRRGQRLSMRPSRMEWGQRDDHASCRSASCAVRGAHILAMGVRGGCEKENISHHTTGIGRGSVACQLRRGSHAALALVFKTRSAQ